MTPLILSACWLGVVFQVTGMCVAARSGDALRTDGEREHESELERLER
jgi:hypothetical protein